MLLEDAKTALLQPAIAWFTASAFAEGSDQ
jgi:hypothetical protein